MLRIALISTLLLFLYTGSYAQDKRSAPFLDEGVKEAWRVEDKLTTAESALYDEANDVIYVSCIAGDPTGKQGNGFIAKLGTDGELKERKWIDGLDAPKGMALHKGKLYVTDIDRIHRIQVKRETVHKTHKVESAEFLNDIAINEADKEIYISDMTGGKIYRFREDGIEEWISGEELLDRPNGMLFEKGKLLVGNKTGIIGVDPASGETSKHVALERDKTIDGLSNNGNGAYFISDWRGKIQLVGPDRSARTLINHKARQMNAADHTYIPSKNLLVVPTFQDNGAIAYKIAE